VNAYSAVLRVPHVAALIAATLLARFPIGINALAIVLYLRAERGSFAVAGAVAGALAAGSGIGAPVQGRLVDAFGQRRVLVPLGIVHAASLGALVASTEAGAPIAVLLVCGFVAGFAIPPTSSVLRSMWPDLLRERPQLLQPAYALDSVLIETIFIAGPLVTALIASAFSPQAALVISAISVIAGTVAFTALPPSRAFHPERERRTAGVLGRSRRPASARWCSRRSRPGSASASARSRCPRSAMPRERRPPPASCSRSGRWAALWADSSTARCRTGHRSAACTSWSPRCCRSACCRWRWRRRWR
jgi:MFS family permease